MLTGGLAAMTQVLLCSDIETVWNTSKLALSGTTCGFIRSTCSFMTQADLNVGLMAGAFENKLLQSRAWHVGISHPLMLVEYRCPSSFLPPTIFGIFD